MTRALLLGRLKYVSVVGDVGEDLGDTAETVGAAAVIGDPTASKIALTLPLYGDVGEGRVAGERLRRQTRAMLSNIPLRAGGLYLRFSADPEQDSWLLIGGGDISYGKAGPTLGEYELAIRDAYRIGNLRTHRPARRLQTADRRSSIVPRDYRGLLFSTDFAAYPVVHELVLPVGAVAPRRRGELAAVTTRASAGGTLSIVDGLADGETVIYEQSGAEQGKSDVVVYDRRGDPTQPPVANAANAAIQNPADPEADWGWEEVHGANYPLSDGDVPVLTNSICRLRWRANRSCFALDVYDPAGSLGAASPWYELGSVRLIVAGSSLETIRSTFVREWTPERTVIEVVFEAGGRLTTTILTLQRGWRGPRLEVYAAGAVCEIRWVPRTSGEGTYADAGGTVATDATGPDWSGRTNANPGPVAIYTPTASGALATLFAFVTQQTFGGRFDNTAYRENERGPTARRASSFQRTSYASVTLGFVPTGADANTEAARLGTTNLSAAQGLPELTAR